MESGDCTVRPATGSDFEGVSRVFAQENTHHVALLPDYIAVADPPIKLDEFNEFLENKDRALLVAEKDGRVIGVALAALKASAEMPFLVRREYVYVMDLAVDEECRGQGIGKTLMSAVEEWARNRDVRDVELNVWEANESARGFYQEIGFASLDRRMTKRL